MRNQAVEHNVAAFSELSLLYAGSECYAEAGTTSNSNESNVSLLTTAVMVDNLAKRSTTVR